MTCFKWKFCLVFALYAVKIQAQDFDFEAICHGENLEHGKDFNEIKFTQTWGYAECLEFKERHGHEPFQCSHEDKASIFAIHGIWPTQAGTSGPSCCEKVKFDPHLLDPIRHELDLYWYEISATKNPSDFWSHEWVKHGSCAKILPEFENQLKYFQGGLDLRKRFDLYSALKEASIVPQNVGGTTFTSSEIEQAFRQKFGVQPYVQCYHTKTGDIHLLAVEMCLDRNLSPMDCSTHDTRHAEFHNSVGPCPPKDPILYQDTIPSVKRAEL